MFANTRLATRLALLLGVVIVIALIIFAFGLRGMHTADRSLESVYADRTIALQRIATINKLLTLNQMWLTDAALFPMPQKVSEHLEAIDRNLQQMTQLWQEFSDRPLSSTEQVAASSFAADRARYLQEGLNPAIQALKIRDFDVLERTLEHVNTTLFPALQAGIEGLEAMQVEGARAEYDKARAAYTLARNTMLIAAIAGIGFSLGFGFLLIRGIIRSFDELHSVITGIQNSRDLSRRSRINGRDELGQTASCFNALMDSLQDTLKSILDDAERVAGTATEVARTTTRIADSSERQSEAARFAATSMHEISHRITEVAQNTQETTGLSQQSSQASAHGASASRSSASEMARIADEMRQSVERVNELRRKSAEIGGIVQVINEIANQTNLLALNAAIEAARAGEQGRGFAVVADEVRKLAERTGGATNEIKGVIEAIQTDIAAVVTDMEGGFARVSKGTTLAEELSVALTQIHESSAETLERIHAIASATQSQSEAGAAVVERVQRIVEAADDNRSAVTEVAAAVRHLEALAVSLKQEVGRFQMA